jgi:hypothetical protein
MKAREWHERGARAEDPFDALSNFWRGFNNLFFTAGNGAERQKITAFLQGNVSEAGAVRLLSEYADCVDYLLSEPVIDMRGNGKDTAPNIAAFKAATTSLEKLEHVLMVVYQVRCNLEHGQKSPNRERDAELCRRSAPIIAALVEHDA